MLDLYTLVLLLSAFFSFSFGQPYYGSGFPRAVIRSMASREERYHHYLWHNIRDNWNRFDPDTQEDIRQRGWEPPRPSRDFDELGNPSAITENNSGEDFLYMHRQMIEKVKGLVRYDPDAYEQLTGWRNIPASDDSEWPVPAEYEIEGSPSLTNAINTRKSDDHYYQQIVPLEQLFNNPDELRSMTLGELGSRIENTIHNWLHLRFSSRSAEGYRPGSGGAFPIIDEIWDDPGYDWLADTYSSHVNPVFWKLHGWVDDIIEEWKDANGIFEIQWIGTWEGGPMETIMDIIEASQEEQEEVEEGMESDVQTFTATSANVEVAPQVTSSFADDVQVDFGTSSNAAAFSQPTFNGSFKSKPASKAKKVRSEKRKN